MNLNQSIKKKLGPNKHRITLYDGRELQFHPPFTTVEALPLDTLVPEIWKGKPLEIEIGPGKGEFLARRASKNTDRYFIGIDRRQDRVELTQNKLSGRAPISGKEFVASANGQYISAPVLDNSGSNWTVIREDARRFVKAGLPQLSMLHIYHPDPWPKPKHNKNRFFRSPDARTWAEALLANCELRISTDHAEYFEEITDIVKGWSDIGRIEALFSKTSSCGSPMTHFEGIFLKKNEPVYKIIFRRK